MRGSFERAELDVVTDRAGSGSDNFLLVLCEFKAVDVPEDDAGLLIAQELQALEARKVMRGAWLVRTRRSAADVLDSLARHLSEEDRLVVAELSRVGWCNIDAGPGLFDELTRRAR